MPETETAPEPAVPATVRAIAEAAARSVGVRAPRETGEWSHQGTSSHVLLIGEAAVRIGRNTTAGDRILRSQRLVDALPDLPFAVPRSLGAPSRRSFPVQSVAFAQLHSEDPAQLRDAVERSVRVLERESAP